MSDAFLFCWLIADFLWSIAVMGTCAYVVFWKGHSGWWFVLALPLVWSETLYRALAKRFGVEEAEDEE